MWADVQREADRIHRELTRVFSPYREENSMKYEIRIDQSNRYGTDTIKGEFESGSEAEAFVETVMEHFQNVTVEITAAVSNRPEVDE